MKKIFLSLFLSMLLFTPLCAMGIEFDYFSPKGFTFGLTNGGETFSLAYGLWVDSHEFKFEGASDTSRFFGPYMQLDWAILPFELNLGGRNVKFGGNVGVQYAVLYTSSDLRSHADFAFAPMISLQARYEAFDVTLGWKGTHYIIEAFHSDYDGDSHNSFQLGIRYTIGKRGWQNKSNNSNNSRSRGNGNNSDEVISGQTRILNGSHSYIRRM